MAVRFSASILTADFCELGSVIRQINDSDVEMVHFDVMDGMFVHNISFGIPVLKSIRKHTDKILDVHLMIQQPERYIEAFAEAGADIITVHAEACTHLHRTVQMIKDLGLKAGVALNPSTDPGVIRWVREDVDMILQMTVNPGFGGQHFIETMTEKVEEIKLLLEDRCAEGEVDIEVDGGINENNLKIITDAGANVIVMGSALLNGEDLNKRAEFLKSLI